MKKAIILLIAVVMFWICNIDNQSEGLDGLVTLTNGDATIKMEVDDEGNLFIFGTQPINSESSNLSKLFKANSTENGMDINSFYKDFTGEKVIPKNIQTMSARYNSAIAEAEINESVYDPLVNTQSRATEISTDIEQICMNAAGFQSLAEERNYDKIYTTRTGSSYIRKYKSSMAAMLYNYRNHKQPTGQQTLPVIHGRIQAFWPGADEEKTFYIPLETLGIMYMSASTSKDMMFWINGDSIYPDGYNGGFHLAYRY